MANRPRVLAVTATASFLLALGVVLLCCPEFLNGVAVFVESTSLRYGEGRSISAPHRKLLFQGEAGSVKEPNRMWGEQCSGSDIVIDQGPTSPLPSGIPTYTVEIMNVCVTGCNISSIHITCGWFSSATLVNPRLFKRLRYNDCLVNDGKPLVNGGSISFEYANTFLYPLKVSSVTCH